MKNNKTVEKFFALTDIEDRTKLLNELKKQIGLSRRFFVSVAGIADIILSPEGILDICHRFNVHVALDRNAPGYAVRFLLCREKAKNVVYAAALVRGATIPGLKASLGTKGAMVLNEATNIAKRLCGPALETIDRLYDVDINEKIRSQESISVFPTIKMSFGDDAPTSISGVRIQLETLTKELIEKPVNSATKAYIDSNDSSKLTDANKQKLALWLREKFIVQRLLSHNRDGEGHIEIIFNNNVRHGITEDLKVDITHATVKSVDHFKNNPVIDDNIRDVFASSVTGYAYNASVIPLDLDGTDFNEWRVSNVTLAEILYIIEKGEYAKKYGTDIFNTTCLGISALVPSIEVDTNDMIVLLNSTTLNRNISATLTYTLNQLYNSSVFSHDSLFNVIKFFGNKYTHNLISFKDIVHYKKNDGTISYSAESLHQKISASAVLNVCFINVPDVSIKAKENGDVLSSFELGDTDKIEEAIMEHNEKSSISFAYHGQFVGLASNSNQKHHQADTSISDDMIDNLHKDKYLLANIDTTINYSPEVIVQKRNVIRNDGGIILDVTNAAQFKLNEGTLKAKVIGENTKVAEEFTKIGGRNTIELITLEAMYNEGKDNYQEVKHFSNMKVTKIDHADMDEIKFETKLGFDTLHEMYSKYVSGNSYEPNYNTTLPNVVRIDSLFGGTGVGTIFSCSILECLKTTEPFFLLEGMNYSKKSIKISINQYELDKGNGELENLYINHASDNYQKRIATILNLYISSRKVDVIPLDAPISFELAAKSNFKLLDFLKMKYAKKIGIDTIAFDLTYKFIGISDERLSVIAREFSNIAVTGIIYKLLRAEAITVISQISHLRYFFRVFVTSEIFDYLDAHIIQTHITSYGALFVAKTESEKLILHGIIIELIKDTVKSFDKGDGAKIRVLMEKRDDGKITIAETKRLHELLVSNNAALWSKEMGAYFDVPAALHDVMGQI